MLQRHVCLRNTPRIGIEGEEINGQLGEFFGAG